MTTMRDKGYKANGTDRGDRHFKKNDRYRLVMVTRVRNSNQLELGVSRIYSS